jgi:ribose 5-phosphate isomerase B
MRALKRPRITRQEWRTDMKIALGCDHAGFELKGLVSEYLEGEGHEVIDEGTFTIESCDYPDFAERVAMRVASGEAERGILVCATGIGMAMTANKIHGVRAAVCNDLYTARYSRLHNDSNVLAIGARVIGPGVAEEVVRIWIETAFEGGRHSGRLARMSEIEKRHGGKNA